MIQPALFQESLDLKAAGRFVSRVDVDQLGIDAALLDRLLAAGPLCFLDFEATGLDPREEMLIEAGAALVRPGQSEAEIFNSFIHTDRVLAPPRQRDWSPVNLWVESGADRPARRSQNKKSTGRVELADRMLPTTITRRWFHPTT